MRDVDVFLFDEPLSNLDAKLRSDLRVEIKRLHQRLKNTMIYVTHDQIEAMTLADRIAVMKDGIIQQLDTPHNIYNRPVNLFVAGFVGSPSMNFLRGSAAAATSSSTASRCRSAATPSPTRRRPAQTPSSAFAPSTSSSARTARACRSRPAPRSRSSSRPAPTRWPGPSIGGQSVTFRADAELDLRPGQTIQIGFDPARGSIFNAESGARL